MKKKNIILCILLCLLFILTCAAPAFAANNKPIYIDSIVAEPIEYTDSIEIPTGYDTSINWTEFFLKLKNCIINNQDSVDLSEYQLIISNTDNVDYIRNYLYNTPELLGFVGGFTYSCCYYQNAPEVLYLTSINFRGTGNNENYDYYNETMLSLGYENCLAQCQDVITQLLYGIKDNNSLSDIDKCLLVHDRLAVWASYDNINTNAGTTPSIDHNAYSALVNRVTVCQGYALAYSWLLDELGIENYYVSSTDLNHGWNRVVLNNTNYYIDVTWDDPVWDVKGQVKHNNLLKSYSGIASNHNKNNTTDFDIGIYDSGTAVDTTYESYAWTSLNTEIQYINGLFYYVNSEGTAIESISTFDGTATPTTVVDLTAYQWYITDSSYISAQSVKLASVGSKLIYNYTDSSKIDYIKAYDVTTQQTTTLYTINTLDTEAFPQTYCHIIAMNVINGVITVDLTNWYQTEVEGKTIYRPTQNSDTGAYLYTCSYNYCQHTNCVNLEEVTPSTQNQTVKAICADCRAIVQKTISACTHSFGAWNTTTTATCKTKGSKTRTCSLCQYEETEEIDYDTTNHVGNTETRNAVIATCSIQAYSGDTYCQSCGNKIANGETGDYDADNHVNTTIINDVTATCKTAGYSGDTYCNDCKTTVANGASLGLNAQNHESALSETAETNSTCAQAGHIQYWYCASCDKNFSNAAGTTVVNDVSKPLSTTHTFTVNTNQDAEHLATAATCIAPATYYYDCAVCNANAKAIDTTTTYTFGNVDTTNHVGDTETRYAVIATCSIQAYSGDTYCQSCGNKIANGETGDYDADNHVHTTIINDVIATCKTAGYSGDTYCDDCKTTVATGTALGLNAQNHESALTENAETDSTCAQAGHIQYWYCASCDKNFSDADGTTVVNDVSKPLSTTHTFTVNTNQDAEHLATAATCIAPATYYYDCAVCNANAKAIDTTTTYTFGNVDTSNHTGGTEKRDVVTANCISGGYTGNTYCIGCNTKLADDGENTGKNSSNHIGKIKERNAVTATCNQKGRTADTYCDACNTTITTGSETAVNTKNHIGTTEVRNAYAPSCVNAGYTGDTYCTSCNTVISTGSTIGRTPHTDANGDNLCDTCGNEINPTTPEEPAKEKSFIEKIMDFFNKIADFFKKLFGMA